MARPSHVYFVRPVGHEGPVKIGHSILPLGRLRFLMQWSPLPLEMVAAIPGDCLLERRLHARFEHLHERHEWFRADPELSATIASIIQGGFDFEQLPEPRVLTDKIGRRRDPWSPERRHVVWLSRRVLAMRAAGRADIPLSIFRASRNLNDADPEVRSHNRALVEDFLMSAHGLSGPALSRNAAVEGA